MRNNCFPFGCLLVNSAHRITVQYNVIRSFFLSLSRSFFVLKQVIYRTTSTGSIYTFHSYQYTINEEKRTTFSHWNFCFMIIYCNQIFLYHTCNIIQLTTTDWKTKIDRSILSGCNRFCCLCSNILITITSLEKKEMIMYNKKINQ